MEFLIDAIINHVDGRDCLRILEDSSVNMNTHNKDGITPLFAAAHQGKDGYVKLLLAQPEINVNAPDKDGWTPLYIAANLGRDSCLKLLLAHPEINVNMPNKDGMTPLYIAANRCNDGCVKLLLAHPEIDVNTPDNDGYTPLSIAANQGKDCCVAMLLEHPRLYMPTLDVQISTLEACFNPISSASILARLLATGIFAKDSIIKAQQQWVKCVPSDLRHSYAAVLTQALQHCSNPKKSKGQISWCAHCFRVAAHMKACNCHRVLYCDKEHQRLNFPVHKKTCTKSCTLCT